MDQKPQELLKKAQSGDNTAFDLLYREYFTPVYRYLFRRIRNKDDAMDMAQTVFLKLATTNSRYEIRDNALLSYLFTIARNVLIDFTRKESHGIIYDDEVLKNNDGPHDARNVIEGHENKDAVMRALDALEENAREIMELRFVEGMKSHEIALIIGKSEESVRQIQSRALKKLRQLHGERN